MVTIEQIDEFRRRTNSSYEDAKVFLERHNGDVLEAIIEFEKSKATWTPNQFAAKKGDFMGQLVKIVQKGFDLRMTVEDKQGKGLFTVPILLLLLLVPVWPMVLLICIGLIFLGYKLGFRDIKTVNVDVKGIFDSLGAQMRDVGRQHAARPGQQGGTPQGGTQNPWHPQQPTGGVAPQQPVNPGNPFNPFSPVNAPAGQPMTQPPTEPWNPARPAEAVNPGTEKPADDGYKEFTVE